MLFCALHSDFWYEYEVSERDCEPVEDVCFVTTEEVWRCTSEVRKTDRWKAARAGSPRQPIAKIRKYDDNFELKFDSSCSCKESICKWDEVRLIIETQGPFRP